MALVDVSIVWCLDRFYFLIDDRNIKITRPGDVELARLFLREETARAGGV